MTRSQLKGIEEFEKKLAIELKKIRNRSAEGLMRAARHLRRESMRRVPVVTGNLKNKNYIQPYGIKSGRFDEKAGVAFGYSAVYARFVHEWPRSGKTGGRSPSGQKYKKGKWSEVGGWKFLEIPFRRNINRMIKLIAGKKI